MSANLERFTGLAAVYDAFRPAPPAVLVEDLTLHHMEMGSDRELGLDRLRAEAERLLGNEPKPW